MSSARPASAFYVAADANHFLGLVGLINSLRLVGHLETIYVGDCGLLGWQRTQLVEQVTLVETNGARSPHLAKMIAPLAHPRDVMVLVDADIIITRPLTGLIDNAATGKIVAFADDVAHRFDERWSELLGLGEPLRRQLYMNSGLVVAELELGTTLLRQVEAGCEHIDVERTIIADGTADYPFYYLDQDVLNAVLATYPPESLELLDHRFAPFPPFAGVRVVDEAKLRCSYHDGLEPYVLHHIARKPWIAATRWNIYSALLARLLLGRDVAVPLSRDEIPRRLRPGTIGWLEKRRSDALAALGSTRGRLGLRRWLTEHVKGS